MNNDNEKLPDLFICLQNESKLYPVFLSYARNKYRLDDWRNLVVKWKHKLNIRASVEDEKRTTVLLKEYFELHVEEMK